MVQKNAFITGISGQDGAYLSKFLLEKGYKVYGGLRLTSHHNLERLDSLGIRDQVEIVALDLLDTSSIIKAIQKTAPDEVYNLASQSFVGWSWQQSATTTQVNAIGTMNLLESVREFAPDARFFQASSSEMFGAASQSPQNEDTPFKPRNPYGVSKVFAHQTCCTFRDALGLFVSCGIMFNHESPLRAEHFVTRKIVKGLVDFTRGNQGPIQLGNLDTERDWGYAGDYVKGMWQMLQQEEADDYVLATGKTVSVRDFVSMAASALNVRMEWKGQGINEVGIDAKTGNVIVEVNPEFMRLPDASILCGDASKADQKLGWRADVDVRQLAKLMVDHELSLASTYSH